MELREGIKAAALAGKDPGPFAATLLAGMDATVLHIDRTEPVDLGVKYTM